MELLPASRAKHAGPCASPVRRLMRLARPAACVVRCAACGGPVARPPHLNPKLTT